MPIARFEMPDGRIARFEVPEGTTPEQAQVMMEAQAPQIAPEAQPELSPLGKIAKGVSIGGRAIGIPVPDVSGFLPPESGERAAALAALPEGRRQLLESISPAEAALIGAGKGFTTIGRAVGLADPETPEDKQIFEELRTQQPIATTGGEIAGEAAPFIAPGLGIAGIGARVGQVAATAGLGATEAALITKGQGRDIGDQLFSAGVGGTLAGALDMAFPVIGRIGGKVIRRFLGKAPEGAVLDASGKPSQELTDALSKSGQSIDDITKEAIDELKSKAVEPREAARSAFLKSQGLEPTRAQVTRNASDFQSQQEAAKTSTRVRRALEKQEAILTTRFNDEILKTGGNATSPTSAVVDSLTEKATRLDQEIGDLYRAAREKTPRNAAGEAVKNIRFLKLTGILRKLSPSDRRAGGNISAIIGDMKAKGILNKEGKLVGQVSVETAEDLRKLTNELYDPANPFGNMLLRQVKNELDDDVFKAAGNDFFKQGRSAKASFEKELNRAKISKFDSRRDNLVRDVLENKIDPDQLVDKVVFGKRWRPDDLRQLKDYISTDKAGKAAFDDMRAEVLQKIKDKAFIGPIDDAGFQALSRDKLQRAIQSIGPKKMEILFTNQEQKFLKDMLEVTKLREPVRGTALGRGPSAQAIARLEQKLRELPALGALVKLINIDASGRAALKARPTPIITPALPSPARAAIAPAVAAVQGEQ